MLCCSHVLFVRFPPGIFSPTFKENEDQMSPCGDSHCDPLPRQGSLCVALPSCHFLVSLDPILPREWDTKVWMLLWLVTNAQAGGRESIFPVPQAMGQLGARKLMYECHGRARAQWPNSWGLAAVPGAASAVLQGRSGRVSTDHLEGLCLFLPPLFLLLFQNHPHVPWLFVGKCLLSYMYLFAWGNR